MFTQMISVLFEDKIGKFMCSDYTLLCLVFTLNELFKLSEEILLWIFTQVVDENETQ